MTQFGMRLVRPLAFAGLLSAVLLLLSPSALGALPLPKKLVAEETLTQHQTTVEFDDIINLVPAGARHLYIEILAATEGSDNNSTALTVSLNSDNGPNYVNRLLFAEAGQVRTQLNSADSAANLMRISAADGQRFGSGNVFIPWAFLDDQKKHLLTTGAANEDYLSTQMAHWSSLDPITSLQFQLPRGESFVAGSSFRLYAIDEAYLIQDVALLDKQADIGFSSLSQEHTNLIVIGQTRSSEINPNRRGDRIWYSINNDNQRSRYQIQRLTGEAAGSYQPGVRTEPNRIIDNQMNEPRIGWNSAQSAPSGVFGPWLLYYPEYTNTATWQTFLSRHGVYDNHWNPIGNEIGRYNSTASIRDLRFFPQRGEEFVAGSRVGIYRAADPTQRYVVAEGGEQTVSLDLPDTTDRGALQLHVAARSDSTELDEDRLLIEVNDDDNSKPHYARLSMTARSTTHETTQADDNDIAILPAGDMPSKLMSSTQISLMGFNDDDRQTAILSYGGVPGDGRIALYSSRYLQLDKVTRLTLRTKSGAPFSAGSVFTVWIDGSPAQDTESATFQITIENFTLVLVVALSLLAIAGFKIAKNNRASRR